MSSKEVKFGSEARTQLKVGVDTIANAIKVTYGPRGRNAIIERPGGMPLITKDGVSVGRSISLKDPVANIGCQVIKSVGISTNSSVGDGTTCSSILAQSIFNEGFKLIATGMNPVLLKRGLDIGVAQVISFLASLSRPVDSEETMRHIAIISANNDVELGTLIGEAVSTVGEFGVISVEEAPGKKDSVTYTEGLKIDKGLIDPIFITNLEKLSAELDDAFIICYDDKLSKTADLLDIVSKTHETGRPLLIIARQIEGEALQTLCMNKEKSGLKVCAIAAPGYGDVRRDLLEDICAVVGGKVFDNKNGRALKDAELNQLGYARRVVSHRMSTTIIDGGGTKASIEARTQLINSQLRDSISFDVQKATLKERLAKLNGGAAVFRVGGMSESEMRERKDRVEDALNAVKAAIEGGILPGGASALLQASKMIEEFIASKRDSGLLLEEVAGLNVLRIALESPFLQIMKNAGFEHFEAKQKILSAGGFSGFDALYGKFVENMFSRGILDPTKVITKGVEFATSAASTLLTTEVAIFRDVTEEIYE